MKITIRLIVSLVFIVALVAVGFSSYQVRAEKTRLTSELERRAIILAESLQESVIPLIASNSLSRLNRLVERFGNRERLKGVAVYDQQGNILAVTPDLASKIPQPLPPAVKSTAENQPIGSLMRIDDKETYFYALPFSEEDKITGTLVLFHDASYIVVRLKDILKHNLSSFLTLYILIV